MPRPRRNAATAERSGARGETIREEVVNTLLAQRLRDQGIAARAERRSRNAIPDIRVTLKSGDTVLLECKWEDSAGQLQHQLDARVSRSFPTHWGLSASCTLNL